jgi:hypothetical protein
MRRRGRAATAGEVFIIDKATTDDLPQSHPETRWEEAWGLDR